MKLKLCLHVSRVKTQEFWLRYNQVMLNSVDGIRFAICIRSQIPDRGFLVSMKRYFTLVIHGEVDPDSRHAAVDSRSDPAKRLLATI